MAAQQDELGPIFGQVLKKYRERKEWSQMKLAAEAELHLNAVNNLERGEGSPNLFTVFALARALGVPPSELVAAVEKAEAKR